MYGKKQRIICFLMAFLLIFTFAFINPLTVSQSQAFAFAPVLTQGMARIITGVLVSAGFVIHEGATATADYDNALTSMSSVIYQMLDGAQKILLGALSIIDNVVEVPLSLYNSIVNKAEFIFVEEDYPSDLTSQGITTMYSTLNSTLSDYSEIILPISYKANASFMEVLWDTRKIDLTNAQPFFIYKGVENATENIFYEEGIEHFYSDIFGDLVSTQEYTNVPEGTVFLTPDISSYGMKTSSRKIYTECLSYDSSNLYYRQVASDSTSPDSSCYYKDLIKLPISSNISNINDYIIKSYFVRNSSGVIYSITDFYDKETEEFVYEYPYQCYGSGESNTNSGLPGLLRDNVTTVPIEYDLTLTPEVDSVPAIPNANSSANVITLPTELSGSIGATSTDVNVSTGTGEGSGTNTETMENINTNVGELVTGGTLGEQVNTNIGTVEGLHGEITGQVDFGAVFDTIAQYISALDISSVVWFSTAVASFLVPFLPLISLGLILFFIDRVLNGGA